LVLVLVAHIALALSLLLPAVLLPLLIRRDGADAAPGRLRQLLVAAQGRWAPLLGLGVAVSGVALVVSLSLDVGRQPWLVVALAIYAVTLAIAMFIQRPALRRLIGLGPGDRSAAARRLRSVSYVMAALIGAIGFLMMAKPQLW
jgi:hypothetical protein